EIPVGGGISPQTPFRSRHERVDIREENPRLRILRMASSEILQDLRALLERRHRTGKIPGTQKRFADPNAGKSPLVLRQRVRSPRIEIVEERLLLFVEIRRLPVSILPGADERQVSVGVG